MTHTARIHIPQRAAGFSPRGFTLVEMVVVVAIILVIVALVVPAASTLWKERKLASAVNTIQGLFMTTRAKAMQADGVETGFLVFVDDRGDQRLVSIEQRPESLDDPAWQNVFVVIETRDHVLPAPMRLVPRYVVDDPADDPAPNGSNTFSDAELANSDFDSLPSGNNQAQRHRNFFTVVFSPDGQLLVRRDVLIQDEDKIEEEDPGDAGRGDRTGLRVGPEEVATTAKYYDADTDDPTDIDPTGAPIPFLVRDDPSTDVAINFPSVDGLLVYDDSLFRDVPASQKRAVLLSTARPLYVSRWTGVVIRGPVGENVTP